MIAIWISSRINHSSSSVVRFTSSCDPSTDGRFRSYTAGEASDLGGGYPYARDLVELQGRKRKEAVRVPAGAASVQTPLKPRSGKSGFVPTLTEYMHSIYVLQGLKAAQF